jgi:hypothetical protein
MSVPNFPLNQATALTPRIRQALEMALAVIDSPRHLDGEALSVVFTDLRNYINHAVRRRGDKPERKTGISRDSLRLMVETNLFQVASIDKAASQYPVEQHSRLDAPGAYRIIASVAIDLESALACDPLRENAAAQWRGTDEGQHLC